MGTSLIRFLSLAVVIGPSIGLFAQDSVISREKLGALNSQALRIVGDSGTRSLPPGIESVRLRAGEYAAARVEATPETATSRTPAGNTRVQLPIRIMGMNAAGESLSLRPVVEVAGGGLRLVSGSGFRGRLHLGLEDENRPTQSLSLGRSIQMLVTGAADSITPSEVSLDHTNLPFSIVEILARNPGDDVQVRIRPDFDPEGIELAVPVVRPVLTIRASPKRIQGYGLETADLVVRAEGAPSANVPTVILYSENARPEPATISLDPATGTATATVRSSGIGLATVTAEIEGLDKAAETLQFVFPWAFVIASLAGGLVGGLYVFLRRRTDGTKRVRAGGLAWHLLLGSCAGFLGSVAYSVGLNLLPGGLHPAATVGEALVFVTAGLCAAASEGLVGKLLGASVASG